MARGDVVLPAHHQGRGVDGPGKLHQHLGGGEHARPCRRQLDRKRQPLQSAAEGRHRRRVGGSHLKVGAYRLRLIDKELDAGTGE